MLFGKRKPALPQVDFETLAAHVPNPERATVPQLLIVADGGESFVNRKAFLRGWKRISYHGLLVKAEAAKYVRDFGLAPEAEIGRALLQNTVRGFDKRDDSDWIQYGPGETVLSGAFRAYAIFEHKPPLSQSEMAGYYLYHARPPRM